MYSMTLQRDSMARGAFFTDFAVLEAEAADLVLDAADADPSPQRFVPPTSGTAANGKPVFSWTEAAAQLTRDNASWAASIGQAATVTYGFRSTAPTTMPEDTAGFSRFNAAQIASAEISLQLWSDVANITFTRVGSGTTGEGAYTNSATMLFSNYATGVEGASAFAYFPSRFGTGASSVAGDVWVNNSISGNVTPVLGEAAAQTLAHEIGHALGLAHPGEYDGGSPTYAADAVYWQDARMFTIMSYFGSSNTDGVLPLFAWGPQLHDIAAAQRLYGANTTTRTGDTVYGFNSNSNRTSTTLTTPNQAAVFSIWDAGGVDTLDFSGYSTATELDLRQEAFSSAGPGNSGQLARGNISIARGAVIENGVGGSAADVINGNEVANRLEGRSGDDQLFGFAGADTLLGGDGADRLTGGDGADVLTGEAGADRFLFATGAESSISAFDRITDFQTGVDLIDVSAADLGQAALVLGGSAGSVYFGKDAGTAFTGLIAVTGAVSLADLVLSAAAATSVYGSEAGETVSGSSRADFLFAAGGADTLIGGGGADRVLGGAGNDTFVIGAVADSAVASADRIYDFASGLDTLNLLAADAGRLALKFESGFINVYFGGTGDFTGRVEVEGVLQAPDILTTALNVAVFGSSFGEAMNGRNGADILFGDGGNDVLVGQGGADALFGGAGSDSFYFGSDFDSPFAGRDQILDFQSGLDSLNIFAADMGQAAIRYVAGHTEVYFGNLGDGNFSSMVEVYGDLVLVTDVFSSDSSVFVFP